MSAIRILYVEDEVSLGKIVKESLEVRGYEVFLETDGAKVMTVFKNLFPDLCILDIMLPHKDGFALADEIRNINKDIPILFLTAKTQTKDVVKGFDIGGNDYVIKPFSMEELIARIKNALRRNRDYSASNHRDIQIGKFIFHQNRQLLVFKNEARKLSFRECELLKLLCDSKDKIIDRKNILNLLWGADSFFNSRNLDVYIARLRSYLKEDSSVEIITVKGVGYRLVTG